MLNGDDLNLYLTKEGLNMYLNVGNSASAEDSAVSSLNSRDRTFCGYDDRGCVCGGVKTGAELSVL